MLFIMNSNKFTLFIQMGGQYVELLQVELFPGQFQELSD